MKSPGNPYDTKTGQAMELRLGNTTYRISETEHRQNLTNLRRLPQVLSDIPSLGKQFRGKPQFVIHQEGARVRVVREDYQERLAPLIHAAETHYSQRLTISEWQLMVRYGGDEGSSPYPVTLHDVYVQGGVTIKMGNPYRNNSWEEFHRALQARSLGIVEAKSPLGFSFNTDDVYGVREPGKMFYKHLTGVDLEAALKTEDPETLNWALWEAGKFLSRLIHANLRLGDADRLGNFFIERPPRTMVLRFLDLEEVHPLPRNARSRSIAITKMLQKFIKKAQQTGLLTEERLGEFAIVCLGAQYSSFALL